VGGTITHHLGRQMRQQKTKKINQIVVLGGSRTTILHNNQPKICRHDGGGIIRDALPDRRGSEGSAIALISGQSRWEEAEK